MKNKKLIKEYGFKMNELNNSCCFSVVADKLVEYNQDVGELLIYNGSEDTDEDVLCVKDIVEMKGLIKEVLEHTGVTLTPKQTKRQEIDTLREELETVKSRLNNLSSWAMSENKRRDVDLRALKYNLKKNGILVDPLTEPKSEPEKTEGVFEVGAPVCVKPYPVYAFNSSATKRNLAKYGAVLVIQDVCGNKRVPGGLEIETDNGRYTVGELQHAPKEAAKVLEFDKWAAIKTGDYRLNEGTKVLLIQELEISGGKLWWRCYTDKDRGSINILAEDLKAL
jgi:predicted RNase H-like nuclease (RuvC/YqgF family)